MLSSHRSVHAHLRTEVLTPAQRWEYCYTDSLSGHTSTLTHPLEAPPLPPPRLQRRQQPLQQSPMRSQGSLPRPPPQPLPPAPHLLPAQYKYTFQIEGTEPSIMQAASPYAIHQRETSHRNTSKYHNSVNMRLSYWGLCRACRDDGQGAHTTSTQHTPQHLYKVTQVHRWQHRAA